MSELIKAFLQSNSKCIRRCGEEVQGFERAVCPKCRQELAEEFKVASRQRGMNVVRIPGEVK